jgi:phosphatidylglycerol:prolipoprotein diacylglycerol transferase
LAVIPTQLIESSATLILFVALFLLYPRHYKERGFVGGCYLMGYAILRFVIEYVRGDPRAVVGPFSISQALSILIFIVGIACVAWSKTKGRSSTVMQVLTPSNN